MSRTILLPIDGSKNSQRAFDFYVNEVRHPEDKVLLVHVQNPPNLHSFSLKAPLTIPTDEWTKQIQEEIKKSSEIVQHYEVSCEQKNISKHTLVGSGKPGEVIIGFVEQHQPSLIVMGSRGLGTLR